MQTCPEPDQPIPLNTGGVPNMPPQAEMVLPFGRVLRNISAATLTPHLPAEGFGTGAAVVVLPGGGFRVLAVEQEGTQVAQALAAKGIAAFVLQYRVRPTPADPRAFGQEMASFMDAVARGDEAPDLAVPPQALEDVVAALHLIRQSPKAWNVDPKRVGLMGFSAGAMAALTHTLAAKQEDMPTFLATVYGPLTAAPVPAHAPPLYAAMAADDPLFARLGFGLVEAWIAAGRPVEFHLLQAGGHGYGLGPAGTTTANWLDGFERWMRQNGWLEELLQ